MSISKVSLCLIFLTFLSIPLVLCLRSPKMAVAASAAVVKKLEKTHVHPPVLPVPESTEVDSSPSAMSGFFRSKFPFQGWPFHKYGSLPMTKPVNPSVSTTTPATGAEEDESEKVPSSPSKGNSDGGNA